MTEDPWKRPAVIPALIYKDPVAALDWLERAFGFRRTMVITDKDRALLHAEMSLVDGEGLVMIGGEWTDWAASAASTGGRNTQTTHVMLRDGLDAHCARAEAAGAEIVRRPEDQFYGDRTYSARDLEGHVWSFSQHLRLVSREEAERASGLSIAGWVEP